MRRHWTKAQFTPSVTVTSGLAFICLFITMSAQASGKGCSESCYAVKMAILLGLTILALCSRCTYIAILQQCTCTLAMSYRNEETITTISAKGPKHMTSNNSNTLNMHWKISRKQLSQQGGVQWTGLLYGTKTDHDCV